MWIYDSIHNEYASTGNYREDLPSSKVQPAALRGYYNAIMEKGYDSYFGVTDCAY